MDIFGHYKFLAVGNYITGLCCFGMAFLVLSANPKSKSCRLAFLFNIGVGLWATFYASSFLVKDNAFGLLVCQLFTTSSGFLSPFLVHLIFVETKKEIKMKSFILFNYLITALLAVLIFIPHLTIKGAPLKLDLPSYIDAGPLYFLVPLQLFSNLFVGIYYLVLGMQQTKGYRRSQLVLFFIAIVVGYATGTPGYLLAINIPIKPYTSPLVVLYPLILSYAIIKHRFLDIQKLLKNSFIFSLLFVLLLGCVTFILFILKETVGRWMGLSNTLAQAIAIALAIAFYGPLKEGLSRFTHRLLFQHAEDPATIFKKLSEDLIHILESQKLVCEAADRVADILAIERIGFYLRSKKAPYLFELAHLRGRLRKKSIHESKQLIQHLSRTGDFLVSHHSPREGKLFGKQKGPGAFLSGTKEMKRQAELELTALGGVAAFPVFIKNELEAVLVIGRKKSDAPWRDEEFYVLKSFVRHLALALANADYADKIRRSREALAERERDASAGALIAAIDHEVKNPVHAASLTLDAMKIKLTDPRFSATTRVEMENIIKVTMESVRADIQVIHQTIQHLSDLANRKPLKIEEGVFLYEVVTRALEMLKGENLFQAIQVKVEIEEKLSIAGDPNALLEIFINLIRNAAQSITGGGLIEISGCAKSNEVLLEIRDTGSGIAAQNLQKIFEPFFTTRRGKADSLGGTGMGLFIVKEYMQVMSGKIEVESEKGHGTLFRLRFATPELALREAA